MKTVFLRALEAQDKAAALRAAIHEPEDARGKQRFEVDAAGFAAMPHSPFAYWVSEGLRRLFKELPPFEDAGRTVKQGLATADDFRFVRCSWEVPPRGTNARWFPFSKGGEFSPFYADIYLVLNWAAGGSELRAFEYSVIRNPDFYFRSGLSYPARPTGTGWFAAVPEGCIFGHNGPMVFASGAELLPWLAVLNASGFHSLVQLMMARGQGGSGQTLTYEVGMIAVTPVPRLQPADEILLAAPARRAWWLRRGLDTQTEISHAFRLPALLQVIGDTLATRAEVWAEHVRAAQAELAAIQDEINERCFDLYRVGEEDRRAIAQGFGGGIESAVSVGEAEGAGDDEGEAESGADRTTVVAELVSWAVGVAFGRFDVRLATGDRALPAEPEPFDMLPVFSPAMLRADDGQLLARPPAGYPFSFPDDGILVDDPGHPRDLTAAVRVVFETVFGSQADAIWQEVAAVLTPRGHDLRSWLASAFFEHHLRRHSKSRRKAPILWQLGVPSGRYSVWCYAHRMTRDSVFAIQNDVVAPKLAHEERRLSSLVTQGGDTPSASDRTAIAAQEAIVDELRILAEEVQRVAPLWNPDLDDGVVLSMAPLWRLVPTHKAWQKELKTRWDELADGKYDWAQLAMHLWAERVVPKCATDRSLAIAHGLEEVFWVEGADDRWTRRAILTRPIDEFVTERTSSAVKAALVSLLEASAQSGSTGRRRVQAAP